MRSEVLRIEKLVYREQGVTLLDNFNLNVFEGEIMGLLPINNQGLTALLSLLRENKPLHFGYVYYREELLNTWRAPRPGYNRISVIQAEGCLVEGLTVADNIFVLRPGFKGRIMRPRLFRQQLMPFLQSVGVSLSAEAYVEELTIFERFVVELLKAIVAGHRLIVIKDISTFVSERELHKLHAILRHFTRNGVSFLYVCVHFEEMIQICDRAALMMDGRVTKILQGSEMSFQSLLPYTEAYDQLVLRQMYRAAKSPGKTVFAAEHLTMERMDDLSFSVREGECLVLQDLDNFFLSELIAVISGERAPRQGRMLLDGRPFCPARSRGIAVIPEMPTEKLLFMGMSYLENLCFTMDHRLPGIWRSRRIQKGMRMAYEDFVGAEQMDLRVDGLTEAEKYQLVYRRVMLQNPRVVFCVQPFRRADVALRMSILKHLAAFLDRGIAVVILAVNLADSLALADRLIRAESGRAREEYDKSHFASIPISAPWIRLYQAEWEEARRMKRSTDSAARPGG